jgi:hypothetical protein
LFDAADGNSDPNYSGVTCLGPNMMKVTCNGNPIGDYNAIRPASPDSRCFVASGDVYQSSSTPAGTVINPHPVIAVFGRDGASCANATQPPPPPFGPPPGPPSATGVTLTCPSSAQTGQGISVSGTLSPHPPGAAVRIVYTEGGSQVTHTLTADTTGAYADVMQASTAGNLTVQVFYDGAAGYQASQSPVCQITVSSPPPPPPNKIPTYLAINCDSSVYTGSNIGMGGQLVDQDGALFVDTTSYPITITWTAPNGAVTTHTVNTLQVGPNAQIQHVFQDFVDTGTQTGTWHGQASFAGNSTYAGSSSNVCATTVADKPPS